MRALIATVLVLAAAPVAAQDRLPQGEDLLDAINAVRADPGGYAQRLKAERAWYRGRLFQPPGGASVSQTVEGVTALDEAITALERQPRLPPLAWSRILANAATDHAISQGEAGARGHVGRDRSNPGERVRRHGGDIYVGEAITYGPDRADAVIRALIVDDGVRDRGHRKLLLGARLRHVGALCADHAALRTICVFDLSATPDGRPELPAAPSE